MFNSKVFLAEFIGTFALVFIGAGAGIANAGLLGVALAHGLVVATFAYTFGYISGTHINPAVTFAMWVSNKLKFGEAVSYWVAQFAGAIVAGWLLNFIAQFSGANMLNGATVGSLTASVPILAAVVEAILTFFLVNAILHSTGAGKTGALSGLVIGLTLTISILVGGPLTGASLNPARTLGIAIFSEPSFTNVYTYVIYLFGPLIGAVLALLVYGFFSGEGEDVAPAVKAEKSKRPARKTAKK